MQTHLLKLTERVSSISKRNLGVFAPVLQKANDPIQQLFLDKLREYKSKASGGKLVEPSPEMVKEVESDKERIYKQYNTKAGQDLSKFPSFEYIDPKIVKPEVN